MIDIDMGNWGAFIFIIAILSILFFPIVSADVISVNSGGNQEIVVNPDVYVEGFFSGTDETIVVETPPASSGGGGGGGGGGAFVNLDVTPTELNVDLAVNTTTERIITVTNLGTRSTTVDVSQSGLGNHIILQEDSITVAPGQSVNLTVVLVALDETGIFVGTINIGEEVVLVSLNVKTKLLLFDSNIIVLNDNYLVSQGDELMTRVTLIPLGDPERLDVGLFFTIRDYAGNTYLTKSETILVDSLVNIDRNFDTGALPLGQYIVGLELRYPNGVAPSSAHFEVVSGTGVVGNLILYIISLILLISIVILVILIWRRRQQEKEYAPEP